MGDNLGPNGLSMGCSEREFVVEPRISFRQVFISSKRSEARADAEAILAQLVALGSKAQEVGDPLLLPDTFAPTPLSPMS